MTKTINILSSNDDIQINVSRFRFKINHLETKPTKKLTQKLISLIDDSNIKRGFKFKTTAQLNSFELDLDQ